MLEAWRLALVPVGPFVCLVAAKLVAHLAAGGWQRACRLHAGFGLAQLALEPEHPVGLVCQHVAGVCHFSGGLLVVPRV